MRLHLIIIIISLFWQQWVPNIYISKGSFLKASFRLIRQPLSKDVRTHKTYLPDKTQIMTATENKKTKKRSKGQAFSVVHENHKHQHNNADLRPILHLDGADLLEAPLHDVLAFQHELTAFSLEVLLLPNCDLELAHLLHLLSVHGCCFSLKGLLPDRGRGISKKDIKTKS